MPNTVKDPAREKLIKAICSAFGIEPDYENAEGNEFVDRLIANGVTVQEWIPVTERLPEKEGNYIVHGNLGGVFCLFYDDILSNSFKQMATHWMHLPEPPKGE